jgi:hypothetical protein
MSSRPHAFLASVQYLIELAGLIEFARATVLARLIEPAGSKKSVDLATPDLATPASPKVARLQNFPRAACLAPTCLHGLKKSRAEIQTVTQECSAARVFSLAGGELLLHLDLAPFVLK